ncbi:MAG: hypothetical protein KDJ65_34505, partial [Anaerolineae bacterium]|nr:hypothetical protein [Anaerolineae bacterium]
MANAYRTTTPNHSHAPRGERLPPALLRSHAPRGERLPHYTKSYTSASITINTVVCKQKIGSVFFT